MDRLNAQPMDFFFRRLEPELAAARGRLAQFVGTTADNLAFVENATYGMNVVAASTPLTRDDEVLLTDHEYGAVRRIWERACRRSECGEPKIAKLSLPFESPRQVVDSIFASVTERTRLLVISHITSPTAVILPVADICGRARELDLPVCIDGPHAPAQAALEIDSLDCDYYAASCHKWLSASFGSGFLYVHPRRQANIEPVLKSWGRLSPNRPEAWHEEFLWTGTRDYTPYLTVPAAIEFLDTVGMEQFRARTHHLAQYARAQLLELTGLEPIVPDNRQWYGSMAHVPLPQVDAVRLQRALWNKHGIEVPIVDWGGRRYIRVSCHLYNTRQQIDRLIVALRELLA
jgi:isopenicillin-N epimerase